MPARHNIVHISFRLLGGTEKVRLRLRPFINFRPLEAPISEPVAKGYSLHVQGPPYEVIGDPDLPKLRLMMSGCEGGTFVADGWSRRESLFTAEGAASDICAGLAPAGAGAGEYCAKAAVLTPTAKASTAMSFCIF